MIPLPLEEKNTDFIVCRALQTNLYPITLTPKYCYNYCCLNTTHTNSGSVYIQ
jgi:hypothetical protein